MARKSNKTAHVLGLITKPKADSTANEAQTAVKPENTPKKSSLSANNEAVSELIRDKLLEELGEKPQKKSQPQIAEQKAEDVLDMQQSNSLFSEEPASISVEKPNNSSLSSISTQEPDSSSLSSIFAQEPDSPSLSSISAQEPDGSSLSSISTQESDGSSSVQAAITAALEKAAGQLPSDSGTEALQSKIESPILPSGTFDDETTKTTQAIPMVSTPKFEELEEPEQPEYDYKYVNVLEELVHEQVKDYLEKFDVCTCDRCIVDTMALALTNLPPKYIVSDKSTISPLLNFYRSKYQTIVMTELTKACLTINEFPRHDAK